MHKQIYAFPLQVLKGKNLLFNADEKGITYYRIGFGGRDKEKWRIGPILWRDIAKIESQFLHDSVMDSGTIRIMLHPNINLDAEPYKLLQSNVLSMNFNDFYGYPDFVKFLQQELNYRGYPDPNVQFFAKKYAKKSGWKYWLKYWALFIGAAVVIVMAWILIILFLSWIHFI